MSVIKDSLFYGKILLFGEYGIIEDSMGLSIPYNSYNGSFIFHSDDENFSKKSNKELQKYLAHLSALKAENKLSCDLDLETFKNDVSKGMLFDSSIPQGYGVGSSGALVAAIYNKYCLNKSGSTNNADIL